MQAINTAIILTKNDSIKEMVRIATINAWGESEWTAMEELIQRESRWNPHAVNSTSGACGLFQSINCDYNMDNTAEQIEWGINYIKSRYNLPSVALRFHNIHNWY